ncbi:hypothetical protein SAMN03159353_1006225 [Cedecea sp. NFIX57]|nr:hypothetical protein SAMN03159353_1006225 [Cedecea sp. NFIX57]
MLSNKNRMAAHGRLFTVIFRFGRCKAKGNKLFGVAGDGFRAFVEAVLALFGPKLEALSKRGTGQALKNAIRIIHCGRSVLASKKVWYAAGIK